MKKFKTNQECYCLYINLTTNYISFKIEVGKYLGKLKDSLEMEMHLVEHYDDEVNYLQLEDIFKTEKEACSHLKNILTKKYGKN